MAGELETERAVDVERVLPVVGEEGQDAACYTEGTVEEEEESHYAQFDGSQREEQVECPGEAECGHIHDGEVGEHLPQAAPRRAEGGHAEPGVVN